MPHVMDTLQEAEVHIREYQEAVSTATPAASQSWFKAILTSIRTRLNGGQRRGVLASGPVETGLDRLAKTNPYLLIQSL